MQAEQLFEVALGVRSPLCVRETVFDAEGQTLTIRVDFRSGSRFSYPDAAGEYPVHDTHTKRYRAPELLRARVFSRGPCAASEAARRLAVRLIEPP